MPLGNKKHYADKIGHQCEGDLKMPRKDTKAGKGKTPRDHASGNPRKARAVKVLESAFEREAKRSPIDIWREVKARANGEYLR